MFVDSNEFLGVQIVMLMAMDIYLARKLFLPAQASPVLEGNGKKTTIRKLHHEVVASDGTPWANIFRHADGYWYIEPIKGSEPLGTLRGRPMVEKCYRLYHRNEVVFGKTPLVFHHEQSKPEIPKFDSYLAHGFPMDGGMSMAYRVRRKGSKTLRTEYIIKIPDLGNRFEIEEIIETEFRLLDRALKCLDTQNSGLFPRHVAVFRQENLTGLIMEYVSGDTLLTYMRHKHSTPLSKIREFSVSLLRAMDALERAQVVHCDLKPSNIVLRGGDISKPCIIDFGIAIDAGGLKRGGSNGYMSPEHMNHRLSSSADVYCVAILIWELLHGSLPVPDQVPVSPVKTERREFENLICQMLAKNPLARPKASDIIRTICENSVLRNEA